jgi:hypothetical protein
MFEIVPTKDDRRAGEEVPKVNPRDSPKGIDYNLRQPVNEGATKPPVSRLTSVLRRLTTSRNTLASTLRRWP